MHTQKQANASNPQENGLTCTPKCANVSEEKFKLVNKEIDNLTNPTLEPLLPIEEQERIRKLEKDISVAALRETNVEFGLEANESHEGLPRDRCLSWFTHLQGKLEERCDRLRAEALSYTLQHVMGVTNPNRFRDYLRARARLCCQYRNVRVLMRMKMAFLHKKEPEAAAAAAESRVEQKRALSYPEKVMRWQAMVKRARRRLAKAHARAAAKTTIR